MRKAMVAWAVAGMVTVLPQGWAAAEEEGGLLAPANFSSKIVFTSDYVVDGLTYSNGDPAIQGSLDYSHAASGVFLGVWGSSWDDGGYSNEVEMGIWGGQAGAIGPINYDVTLYYWFYPGAKDSGNEFDYFQAGVNLGHTFEEVPLKPTFTIGYLWSPEYFGEEGAYNKILTKAALQLPWELKLGLEAAHIDIEGGKWTGNGQGLDGEDGYDWEAYRVSLSREIGAGFNLDLSYYYGSEEDFFDDIAGSRVVVALSRTF